MLRRLLHLTAIWLLCAGLLACHTVGRLDPFKALPQAPDMTQVLAQAKLKLQRATPCCNSYADFSYQTRLPWQPTRFQFGANSPVANLNGSRTHFMTFALPYGLKLPYEIGFKAEINGRWVHSSYLFAPTFTVLDAAFQPIANQDVALCEYMGWSDATSGAFGRVVIHAPEARYLVLYSSASQLSSNTYWEQSTVDDTAGTGLMGGMRDSNSTMQVQHGPDGAFWVGMMSNAYRRALDKAICEKPKPGNGLLSDLGGTLEFWRHDSGTTGADQPTGTATATVPANTATH